MYIRLPSFVKIWLCLWIWCLKYFAGKSPSYQNPDFPPLKFRKHGARRVWHLSWENLNFSRIVAGMRKLFWVTSKGIFRLRPTQIWRRSSQQFWNWDPLKHARTYTLYPVYPFIIAESNTTRTNFKYKSVFWILSPKLRFQNQKLHFQNRKNTLSESNYTLRIEIHSQNRIWEH